MGGIRWKLMAPSSPSELLHMLSRVQSELTNVKSASDARNFLQLRHSVSK